MARRTQRYNFDRLVSRKGTASYKYDHLVDLYGTDNVLPMWVADMDFPTADFIMEAVRERAQHEFLGYTFRTDGFYSSIQDWMKRKHQWEVEKEWIVFSPGVVPALNMCVMEFTSPGDGIIVQPPVYFPFFSTVTGHNRELLYNQLVLSGGRYTMDLDHLSGLAQQGAGMLILCNPHNPVGRAWSGTELEKVAEICLKNDLLILSDEIHADLVFQPSRHIPVASLSADAAARTISFFAPSKSFNTAGLSTSFVIIPDSKLRNGYENMLRRLHAGMGNIFGNVALEAAYTSGIHWLEEMMQYTLGNIRFMERYLHEHIPRIRMITPEATYLVWLDCSRLGMNDRELEQFFVRDARLGLSEGFRFGPGGEGFMRMNVACPRAILEQALEQLRLAVKQL